MAALVVLSACATQQTVIVVTATPDAAPQPTATERVIVVTATPIPPTPTERVIVVTATPETVDPQPTATARVVVVTATPRPTRRPQPTAVPPTQPPPGDLAIDLDNAPGGANNDDLDVTITASRFNRNGTNFVGFRVLARSKGSAKDGDGIDSVQFTITNQDEGTAVYFHTERTSPYCAFQESSGTNCRVLTAKSGDEWRASDASSGITQVPFRDGTFKLLVTVLGKNNEVWFAESTFRIKTTGNTEPPKVTGCKTGQTAITSPADNSTLKGVVKVQGTATCDNLWYYKFEFEDPRCDNGVCFVAGPSQPVTPGKPFTKNVVNGLLMNWDTRKIPNGTYTLRLVATGQGGVVLPQISRIVVTIAN